MKRRVKPGPHLQLQEMNWLAALAPEAAIRSLEAWHDQVLDLPKPNWNQYVYDIYTYCKLPRAFSGE